MTPADRSALIDRVARARAWNALSDAEKTSRRSAAAADVSEIELTKVQIDRLGWILLDMEPEEVEP